MILCSGGDVWPKQPAFKEHPWRTMKNPNNEGGNAMVAHYSGTTLGTFMLQGVLCNRRRPREIQRGRLGSGAPQIHRTMWLTDTCTHRRPDSLCQRSPGHLAAVPRRQAAGAGQPHRREWRVRVAELRPAQEVNPPRRLPPGSAFCCRDPSKLCRSSEMNENECSIF